MAGWLAKAIKSYHDHRVTKRGNILNKQRNKQVNKHNSTPYLTSWVCIIYKINPNFPVSSLYWSFSKDRHLHSFLVIFSWSSERSDLDVLLQRWQCDFNVIVYQLHFSVGVDHHQASPVVTLLGLFLDVMQ